MSSLLFLLGLCTGWDEAKVYLMVRIILGTRLDLRFHTP